MLLELPWSLPRVLAGVVNTGTASTGTWQLYDARTECLRSILDCRVLPILPVV